VVAKIKELSDTKEGLKIVLSERDFIELSQKEKRRRGSLKRLKVGDVIEGRVIKIDPEKGITLLIKNALRAFLPKEELSWGRDRNPYNYTEVGEKTQGSRLKEYPERR
jgi:small subunit ribosomal protein S1